MPLCLKLATIIPLLKRYGLDKKDMNSYRPISNLLFISKFIENIAASRIEGHLEQNNLTDIYQPGYSRGHSTETALLKVKSDIAEAFDEGSVTALIRLDLSATFYVFEYPILLKRLTFSFGTKDDDDDDCCFTATFVHMVG